MTGTANTIAESLHKEFTKTDGRLEAISPFGGIMSVIEASNDEQTLLLRKENPAFDTFFQAKIRILKTKPPYEQLLDLLDAARLQAKESWIILSALLLDFYGEDIHHQYLSRYFIEDKQMTSQYVKTKAITILLGRMKK